VDGPRIAEGVWPTLTPPIAMNRTTREMSFVSRGEGHFALATEWRLSPRTPVLPEATFVGALSAHMRRCLTDRRL
jgi:hypothetical protein